MSDEHGLYWIAVNGASCALATWPMTRPQVSPVPEQMWGFPTYEEAKKAQDICINAPMERVMVYLKSLGPDIRAGRVKYFRPENPQPPTIGPTVWLEDRTDAVQ